MGNISTHIKKNNPNIYSLITSFFIAIWFNGVHSLINNVLPQKTINISLLLMVIPILIFLLDNGKLDELSNTPTTQYPANILNNKQSVSKNIGI